MAARLDSAAATDNRTPDQGTRTTRPPGNLIRARRQQISLRSPIRIRKPLITLSTISTMEMTSRRQATMAKVMSTQKITTTPSIPQRSTKHIKPTTSMSLWRIIVMKSRLLQPVETVMLSSRRIISCTSIFQPVPTRPRVLLLPPRGPSLSLNLRPRIITSPGACLCYDVTQQLTSTSVDRTLKSGKPVWTPAVLLL